MIPDFFNKINADISWIKNRTLLLVEHGSKCYGTYIPGVSDIDYKGFCVANPEYYHGFMKNFEQAELKDPDFVCFEIRKFFRLAADANPNCLEVLFVDPSNIVHLDPLGEEVIANRELFLSKKVKHTMMGYAHSQLSRLRLHRQYHLSGVKAPPSRKEMGLPEQTVIPKDQLEAANSEINKVLSRMNFDFMESLDESAKIEIKRSMQEMLADLKINQDEQWISTGRKIGLSDSFLEIMKLERAYNNKKREWDNYQNWKLNRNKERAAMEEKFTFDTKHALHVTRLLRMGKEILETGKVNVRRPDAEELLSIRNGAWSYEQLMEFADNAIKDMEQLYHTSGLPHTPDRKKIDDLCISIVERMMK